MEEQNPRRRKRQPRAWLYEDGVKKPLEYVKSTDRLSAAAIWIREHPEMHCEFTKAELRAILK